jgi:hypothetical protein
MKKVIYFLLLVAGIGLTIMVRLVDLIQSDKNSFYVGSLLIIVSSLILLKYDTK